jgi:hypothetical protein
MTKRTILEEIRVVRHAISEEIGHDPRRITEYYSSIQAQLKDRIVNRGGEQVSFAACVEPPTTAQETQPDHLCDK